MTSSCFASIRKNPDPSPRLLALYQTPVGRSVQFNLTLRRRYHVVVLDGYRGREPVECAPLPWCVICDKCTCRVGSVSELARDRPARILYGLPTGFSPGGTGLMVVCWCFFLCARQTVLGALVKYCKVSRPRQSRVGELSCCRCRRSVTCNKRSID